MLKELLKNCNLYGIKSLLVYFDFFVSLSRTL